LRIAVVIPTLGEVDTIAAAIDSARLAFGSCEVVVADGGSTDGTRERAAGLGATVVDAPGSRAEAMNRGAEHAGGEALVFLHADTLLPPGAGDAVRRTLAIADAGAFSVRFDERPRIARGISAAYGRFRRVAYGDQAIFVSSAAFERAGGYRPLPIMEDIDLVRRLRRTGTFVVLRDTVTTSARRHRANGEVRTFLSVATIKLLYRLGAPPGRLAPLYRRLR
jgi:rSAM/selenodomain-associated transferase 2